MRFRRLTIPLTLITALLVLETVRADSIALRDASIAIRECTIEELRPDRVYYTDARGRRQWRPLDEVAWIGFDDLPQLERAEKLFEQGSDAEAFNELFLAVLDAGDPLQRLWSRLRLVRAHRARGETVQAAGHLAVVYRLHDEPGWQRLEPVGQPRGTTYAAAKEALENLVAARRSVDEPELAASIDRMLGRVKRVAERLADEDNGPSIEPDGTISGLPVRRIRAGDVGDQPAPRNTRSRGPANDTNGTSPDAIDALLADGRSAEALAICERLAADPGNRGMSRFLHQYGRALAREDRPRDAAVMLLRGAILYDGSRHAAPSLIEAAIIHRDVFDDPAAARRLLERAVAIADAHGDAEALRRARELLKQLPEIKAP